MRGFLLFSKHRNPELRVVNLKTRVANLETRVVKYMINVRSI
jgi:hypothetical protein